MVIGNIARKQPNFLFYRNLALPLDERLVLLEILKGFAVVVVCVDRKDEVSADISFAIVDPYVDKLFLGISGKPNLLSLLQSRRIVYLENLLHVDKVVKLDDFRVENHSKVLPWKAALFLLRSQVQNLRNALYLQVSDRNRNQRKMEFLFQLNHYRLFFFNKI